MKESSLVWDLPKETTIKPLCTHKLNTRICSKYRYYDDIEELCRDVEYEINDLEHDNDSLRTELEEVYRKLRSSEEEQRRLKLSSEVEQKRLKDMYEKIQNPVETPSVLPSVSETKSASSNSDSPYLLPLAGLIVIGLYCFGII